MNRSTGRRQVAQTGSGAPLAIVDIDGVVADVRHRLPLLEGRVKDWEAFFAAASLDPPHPEGVDLVLRLAEDHDVVFLTGRPSRIRRDTQRWLDRAGLGGHRLVMRPDGERRPAARMKVRLLDGLAKGRTVAVVVDDDRAVCRAMREAGYPTLHAAWEDRSRSGQAALLEAQEADGRT
ncbi:MAG: phosphatase domain-containing protein [Sporichthyaceae bacterium]